MGNKEKTDASTRGAAPLITYDGFLVEFNGALEAAQCAVEIQRALSKRNDDMPIERRVEIRPPVPASCSMREAFKTFRFCLLQPGSWRWEKRSREAKRTNRFQTATDFTSFLTRRYTG